MILWDRLAWTLEIQKWYSWTYQWQQFRAVQMIDHRTKMACGQLKCKNGTEQDCRTDILEIQKLLRCHCMWHAQAKERKEDIRVSLGDPLCNRKPKRTHLSSLVVSLGVIYYNTCVIHELDT
jgi:hypothetical protein